MNKNAVNKTNNFTEIIDLLHSVGVNIPEVLLPKDGSQMDKWAVVACDQYTSQPEYWNEVQSFVNGQPSTLNLILPEVYLEEPGVDKRINKINGTMEEYINNGTLVLQQPGFIFLDRKTSQVPSRKGLIITIDLEEYDYNAGSQTLVRATEKTVIDRLPPRVKIRKDAPIELPHIQILIDDPERTVIEPLAEKIDLMEKIYDFELMMGGGHVKGYKIENEKIIKEIALAISDLAKPEVFYNKYNVNSNKGILLFAVGDGNHSLASAKAHWENVKASLSPEELAMAMKSHPARYAMAELINVYDDGLIFEPIHRVLFNIDFKNAIEAMKTYFSKYSSFSLKTFNSKIDMYNEVKKFKKKNNNSHILPFVSKDCFGFAIIEEPRHNLETATLQEFLDDYLEQNRSTKIDYIHGDEIVTNLGAKDRNIGFYLPAIDKHELFKTVILDGTLPRKTFSMGEADEKRFYIECRRIK